MRAIRRLTLGVATLLLGSCATPHLYQAPTPGAPERVDAVMFTTMVAGETGPPIALTSADGKALELKSVKAESVVAGPLAFTQMKLVFHNPEPRTIEGRFRIALPEGASVSRFAMKIAGRWQEGEMLEKAKARRIYEDFLHQRVDPALLEQAAGNAFSARVFPIPAKADKELIIAYGQPLEGPSATLVPLEGLDEIDQLHLEVTTNGPKPKRALLTKTAFKPEGDFVLDPALASGDGLRSGELVVTRVAPMAGAEPDRLGRTLFLVDTSASRALDLTRQTIVLHDLLKRMGNTSVLVAAFDQAVTLMYEGPANRFGAKQIHAIRKRRAMGASDLGHAFAWAGRAANKRNLERLVLLGDGVVTAGREGNKLLGTTRDLARQGVQRLDVVAFGGIRDGEGLQALVTAGLPRDGVVLDSQRGSGDAWRRLNLATKSGVKVQVEGASWWWPQQLDGVQPGDEVLVHAEVPEKASVRIRLDGDTVAGLRFVQAERPLVERSWARAKIASLVDRERQEGDSKDLREQIVALSTQHRVMSPYTSMLVLETQQDYERYKLDRDALADILEIVDGKLTVAQRQAPEKAELVQAPWGRDDSLGSDPLSARGNMWGDSIGEAFGAGGLGLSGIGEGGVADAAEFGMIGLLGPAGAPPPPSPPPARGAQLGQGQGFGAGHGRLGRSHRARPPRIRMGTTSVSGRLPPEVVRRIVRANYGRLRGCYLARLRQDPQAQGRVTTRFLIKRDGTVGASQVTSSTIASSVFKSCIAQAFKAMTFPQPEGGFVTVTYPVVFQPAGRTSPPPTTVSPQLVRRPRLPSTTLNTATGQPATADPYAGRFAKVMAKLGRGEDVDALGDARRWQKRAPGDVLALVALGEAYEANGEPMAAARAYGSIIDLFPSRADLRRYAGERLDRLDSAFAKRLAIDTYARAKEQRPDHPTSHRLLGYALLRDGQYEASFAAVAAGLMACKGRYVHADKVLRRDLGLIAAAWLRATPKDKDIIEARLFGAGATLATEPSLQLVLNWETDTNDVDLHVYDTQGGHAFYSAQDLQSGGRLHGDITTGYGPELFTIDGKQRAKGYKLQVHYYSRGPMGYGMGKIHVIDHDGQGKLSLQSLPFIVMKDQAFVDVGTLGEWGS